MLSVKKVKLHGMQDHRWSTKDKMVQYRGLISLYSRDRKIMDYDKVITKKKQAKDLKEIQKKIIADRAELDNAIHGDRQKVRNTLAEDRNMQLAYQNLHPSKIVDHIYQDNFNKRKELDRINYRLKMKTNSLVELKLEYAELQDRLVYDGPGKIQVEIEAGIITGKVQDAILKKEAAITVQLTYTNIINIMNKDRIYYDAVLKTLQTDCTSQGVCLLHTTQMGQLATEYLDDRHSEYVDLEKTVRMNMHERERQLVTVNLQVEAMSRNVKNLVRRDSDINVDVLGATPTENTVSEMTLHTEIEFVRSLLEELRSATMVSTFKCIFPCLEAQKQQAERLRAMLDRNLAERNRLAAKEHHAQLIHNQLRYTMVGTTFEYKSTKAQLLADITEQQERKRVLAEMVRQRGELHVCIRKSLQHLQEITQPLMLAGEARRGIKLDVARSATSQLEITAKTLEMDGFKLIEILSKKLTALAALPTVALDDRRKEDAEVLFQKLVAGGTGIDLTPGEIDENNLLEGIVFEDAQIPTRDAIKAKSKEIVDQFHKMIELEANAVVVVDRRMEKKLK